MTDVKTRFAPSPTGDLHIGGIRTALFSWLYARHHGGEFVLRVEDTDRQRSTPEAIDIILDGMNWLGLDCDEGPIYQSHRSERYQEVIQELLEKDQAYFCYCSREELEEMRAEAMERGEKPRYDGRCRSRHRPPEDHPPPVIRFKNPPDGEVVINDLIQGQVVYRNTELDDLIIARADGSATYNLSVVVDDMDMGISHVIRGDDHLNNTPRQINIFRALDTPPPEYAHIPLILGPDGKKLSKRHGAASVLAYRDQGFLPEALLNYLVRLGWSHGDQEIFSLEEMIRLFDISDVNKSAAAINPDKLLWLNQHYLQAADDERLAGLFEESLNKAGLDPASGPPCVELVAVQKHRVKTLVEMVEQSRCFYEDFEGFDENAAKKHLRPAVLEPLQTLREQLSGLSDWTDQALQGVVERVAGECGLKLGKLAQPLRVAVTGSAVSPSIDVTLRLLGQARTILRLDRALDYIRRRAAA
jgi:glutamyl-tRNA synthetase